MRLSPPTPGSPTSRATMRGRAVRAQASGKPPQPSRRGLLVSLPIPVAALIGTPRAANAGFLRKGAAPPPAAAAASAAPVIDQKMVRLRLPKGAVGRDYVLMQLKLGGRGPFDFMVDSGLTAELITPHLRGVLGIASSNQRLETGLGAGGSVSGAELVTLQDATLVGAEALRLPPLTAVVTDFVQEHLDPDHDPVEGMLGMELLRLFDCDLDFAAGRLRLWAPGAGAAAAEAAGLAPLPAAVLNETGVLGIRATVAGARSAQPFVGIVDCGASFSAVNWAAATLAGLPPRGDSAYGGRPTIYGVGVDGAPLPLPTMPVPFTYAGAASGGGKGGKAPLEFEPPAPGWKAWAPVQAAVGDLPVFAQLLGDGKTPFSGPAALIGLDVLAQRRVIITAGLGQKGRARTIWVSKS